MVKSLHGLLSQHFLSHSAASTARVKQAAASTQCFFAAAHLLIRLTGQPEELHRRIGMCVCCGRDVNLSGSLVDTLSSTSSTAPGQQASTSTQCYLLLVVDIHHT
jgi:hypothetical protein